MIKLSPFVGFTPVAAAEIILTRQIHASSLQRASLFALKYYFGGGAHPFFVPAIFIQ